MFKAISVVKFASFYSSLVSNERVVHTMHIYDEIHDGRSGGFFGVNLRPQTPIMKA